MTSLIVDWPSEEERISRRYSPPAHVKFAQISSLHLYKKPITITDHRSKAFFGPDDFDFFANEATLYAAYITKKMAKWRQDLPSCLKRLQDQKNIPPEAVIGVEHMIGGRSEYDRRAARRDHYKTVLMEQTHQRNSGVRDPDKLAKVSMRSSMAASDRAANNATFVANLKSS